MILHTRLCLVCCLGTFVLDYYRYIYCALNTVYALLCGEASHLSLTAWWPFSLYWANAHIFPDLDSLLMVRSARSPIFAQKGPSQSGL